MYPRKLKCHMQLAPTCETAENYEIQVIDYFTFIFLTDIFFKTNFVKVPCTLTLRALIKDEKCYMYRNYFTEFIQIST